MRRPARLTAILLLLLAPGAALAAAPPADRPAGTGGRLLLTAGVTQLEGAAGGGLTPWAVIGGYGTRDQVGGSAFLTGLRTRDYGLTAGGALLGLYDRLELSVARQSLDTRAVGAALGLGRGFTLRQTVAGAKLRLAGDAVLDQDRPLPQLAVGVQYKDNDRGRALRALGARRDDGTDLYAAATKLFLAQGLLLNGTMRLTRANQTGLLGFGGRDGRYRVMAEGSAALLLGRHLVAGAEYRMKPDNLAAAREDDWYDLFLAWAPSKRLSVTLAYADLGRVATRGGQRAAYLSLQVGF